MVVLDIICLIFFGLLALVLYDAFRQLRKYEIKDDEFDSDSMLEQTKEHTLDINDIKSHADDIDSSTSVYTFN